MTTKYQHSKDVPLDVLIARLEELSTVIARGTKEQILSELTQRIPAELDRDADLVIAEAARRLREKWKDKAITYMREGDKIKAIKLCRQLTGMSLKDAKYAVEALEVA